MYLPTDILQLSYNIVITRVCGVINTHHTWFTLDNNEDPCLKVEHTIIRVYIRQLYTYNKNKTLVYAIIKKTVNEYCVDII